MSPEVIEAKAAGTASSNAPGARASAERSPFFILLHIFSIGLRSGEYAGRKRTSAPASVINRRV